MGEVGIKHNLPAERLIGAEQAQNKIGVCHRRFITAAIIAGRSWRRARALRSYFELTCGIHPADTAAAGADCKNIDRRDLDRHIHHVTLVRHRDAFVGQQAHVETSYPPCRW